MKRRVILLYGAVLGLLVGTFVFFVGANRSHSRINHENFDRIHVGMAKDDVYSLLGGPPRSEVPVLLQSGPGDVWLSRELTITICYDANDLIYSFRADPPAIESLTARVRRWLGF
jgi:hypothetical protein